MQKSEKAMRWGLRIHLFWYVVAHVAQVVVWGVVTPDLFFWPLWSIVGWGIGLAIHYWAIRAKFRTLARP
ncbi:2TM domain-containing protein [Streptomyces sp. NPDC090106]|uniref:2TM domain-containing protein n=1 Tax=Streptomyces sp. NPDC090106 TaxID=3365946 RepID=UPI0038270D99